MNQFKCLGADTLECLLHNLSRKDSDRCRHSEAHDKFAHRLCSSKHVCCILTRVNLHKSYCTRFTKK
jgi:hypothetical protein